MSALVASLQGLGAAGRERVLEQNTLYDTPGSNLRRGGCLLRLRVETPAASSLVPAGLHGAVLTFKASPVRETQGRKRTATKGLYKEKLERELAVRELTCWRRTLAVLGFHSGFRYEKYRSSFRLSHLHVDLDETPVGDFLELEGSPRSIQRVASALGYTSCDYIRATYWELYVADCKRKGSLVENMVFDT